MGLFEYDLDRVDADAADRGAEDDLAREGVEGHLVVGLVLGEVVLAGGGGGGFVVFDEEGAVEGDDFVEVAAEDVGLRE